MLPFRPFGYTLALLGLAVLWGGAVPLSTQAQEQFFTQSGGRGLQNAKTNARLSKAEGDIGVIFDDLRTVQPHARAQLGNCANTGEKLRYDGRNWICEKETDPTVKGFAKKDLPSCTGSSILGVSGGDLSCVQSGFVSNETDPTVQTFAKAPLPGCGIEDTLAVQNGVLTCRPDQKGITAETDPRVHDFARRDIVSALPNCAANEMLTMAGARLSCKVDQLGITAETDPLVQAFARTDSGQPPLAACIAGQVLKAATVGGKVVLQCEAASSALAGALALDDLSDVESTGPISGTVLTFSNGQWRALAGLGSSGNPLFLSSLADVGISGSLAADQLLRYNGTAWVNSADKVGALTDTNWCRVTGGKVVCDRPAPLTCSATEVLKWNGASNTWLCEDVGSGIGAALSLNTLNDVTITTPAVGQALRYDGTGWVNSVIERIITGDSQIVVTDTGSNGLLSFATDGLTRMAITNEGRVGIGIMPSSPYMLDISGSLRASNGISTTEFNAGNGFFSGNLTVQGNLNISGSQSLDGVLFANGGIEMPGTLTSANVSVTNLSATVADIRTLRVTNNQSVGGDLGVTGATAIGGLLQAGNVSLTGNQTLAGTQAVTGNAAFGADVRIAGNLYVSGSQAIDGVLFANGGIEMPGTLTSGNVSVTNLSATLADIRTLRADNISTSGNISANQFIGDGSRLTGVVASGADWYGLTNIPAPVQAVSNGTSLVMAGISTTNSSVTTNLTVGGTLTAGSAGFGPVALTNLTAANISASANVSITGNASAANFIGNFVGDGSGLTGVTAAATDRITSGTTSLVAVSTTGFISLTQAGTNTGWFDPTRGLVTLGVSATGGISATTGYFAGRVGIGTTNPSRTLSVNGITYMAGLEADDRMGILPQIGSSNLSANIVVSGDANPAVVLYPANTYLNNVSLTMLANLQDGFRIMEASNVLDVSTQLHTALAISYTTNRVGIYQTTPSTTLHVAGTLRLANGGEACDANRVGGIRYTANEFSFCRNGTAWETLSSIANAATPDRIISGTASAIASSANSRIDISGSLNLPAQNAAGVTNNAILQNGSRFIHTFRPTGNDGQNLFVGVGSGNTSMISTTTASAASYNTGIGYFTLAANTTGFRNTASGLQALINNTTGHSNTANGVNALGFNTTGFNNTTSGIFTLYENTTASNNTALGFNTGRGITTGSNNTILGANVTGLAADLSNTVIIADGSGNRRIYADAAGRVGIGTSAPSSTLHVAGSIFGHSLSLRRPNDGSFTGILNPMSGTLQIRGMNSGVASGDPMISFVNTAGNTQAAMFVSSITGLGMFSVNISDTLPSATLHVGGTLRLADGGEACDANRVGGIRYTAGEFSFCRNGTAWETLSSIANAATITAAGVVGSVQFKGVSNEISGSSNFIITNAAARADVAVSGTLKLAGSGAEACSGASEFGQMRFVDVAGRMTLQLCRP